MFISLALRRLAGRERKLRKAIDVLCERFDAIIADINEKTA